MSLSTGVPNNWRLPLFWAVVDGSKAGNLTESQPALLIGQAFCGGDASVSPKVGMVGTGTLTLDNVTPVLQGSALGVWRVVFTSTTAFTVTAPAAGLSGGTGVVGQPYAGPGIKFTIAAGATAFAAADEFDVTVNALPSGTAPYNVPVPIGSVALAKLFFGEGSMLERMVNRFFDGNTTQQVWALPIPRPAAGTKAAGSVRIATQQTASGVLTRYIAGQRVQITVYQSDSQAIVAANLAAAINALTTLPVVAAVDAIDTAKVNLVCRWHGLTGNDITILANYRGVYGGEVDPVGLTTMTVSMNGGFGTPDFTAAISAIQATQFYHFAMPYSDTASLQIWDAEVGFGPTGRWAFARQQYGWIYNARRDTYTGLLLWGLSVNSPVISTAAIEPGVPTPVWEMTAAYCAQGAYALLDDPANSLQTLELAGCLPATVDQQLSQTQRNNLVNSGLSVFGVAPSGAPMILVEAMQYQRNQYGQSDTAFFLMTTLSNLAEVLSRLKSAITSKYARVKLFKDGTKLGPGQRAVTPIMIKAELVSEAEKAAYDGLMQSVDEFVANLIVEIDDNNPNRLNVLFPPQLAGQLRQFAVLAQFRLLYEVGNVAA